MNRFTIIFISCWVIFFACAQKRVPANKMIWLTLDEATKAMDQQKKPVLIDLYTDWCGWCKVMDKRTYTNKNVIEYLQANFYCVKLNAETTETLMWMGKSFKYNPNYKANDMAIYLTGGRLSFPTTIIIPTDGSGPQPIPGYLQPKELELVVKYFGEGKYGVVDFEAYQKSFTSKW